MANMQLFVFSFPRAGTGMLVCEKCKLFESGELNITKKTVKYSHNFIYFNTKGK